MEISVMIKNEKIVDINDGEIVPKRVKIEENWDDKTFVMKKVKEIGFYLEDASERLKDDEEVVIMSMEKSMYNMGLKYASNRLKDNKEFVMMAIKKRGYYLKYASARWRRDEEFIMKAMEKEREFLYFIDGVLGKKIDRFDNYKKAIIYLYYFVGHKIEFIKNEFDFDLNFIYFK